jgi:hypothetical protein
MLEICVCNSSRLFGTVGTSSGYLRQLDRHLRRVREEVQRHVQLPCQQIPRPQLATQAAR